MAISWAAALRLYAKQKGFFVVPKKGTEHYDAIKKLQGETDMSDEHKVKPRMSKKKMNDASSVTDTEEAPKKEMTRKGRTGKHYTSSEKLPIRKGFHQKKEDVVPVTSADTSLLQDSQVSKKELKTIVKKPLTKKVVKEKGVKADGLTKPVSTTEFLVNDNVGAGTGVSSQFAGQKEQVKKQLRKAKKTETTDDAPNPNPEEKTIDNMKTDDPKGVDGSKAGFSFQALRNRLLC